MLPVLLAVLLSVSARAVPPSFESAQASFLRGSANDGFHEALDTVPGPEGDIDLLLQKSLEKVAFQPFGLLVDKNKNVGKRLNDMMAMGASQPWPDALSSDGAAAD